MKLTKKLIGYLNRVFDKGPEEVLAFRLRYAGTGMTWSISNAVLTITTVGGSAPGTRAISLKSYTLASLVSYLSGLTGFSIEYQNDSGVMNRAAVVLLEGQGDQDASNGDHFKAFTSVLWAYMDAQADALTTASEASAEALLQMSAVTAEGEWVDEHGTYYKVKRNTGELDAAYVARMVSEVVRARGNNVAIADSIERAVSGSEYAQVRVTDYGTITVAGDGTKSYGLFDVTASIDINTPLTFVQIDANLRSIIEAMRDAGTHLRTLKYIMTSRLQSYAGVFLMVGSDTTIQSDTTSVVVLNETTICL